MADITFADVVNRGGGDTIPSGLKLLRRYVFSNKSMSRITIPNDIQYLPNGTFSDCMYLQTIVGLDHIKYIGGSAFNNMGSAIGSSSTDIVIPNGCDVDNQAFSFAKIRSIIFGENSILGQSVLSSSYVTDVTFNTGCVAGAGVCYQCTQLTTVVSNIKVIPINAFYGCIRLTSVTLNNVTAIESSAFYGCRALTNINIPSTIDSITNNAFQGCTNLTTITIDKPQDSVVGAPWGATNATVIWTG